MALTFNTTTRRALRWLTGSNLVSDIDAGFQALAEDVDAQLLTRSFGKSIVATAETRVNTAYGLMPTPDRVQSIVLPTDGLIAVLYQATWQESVADAARAAIFIGSNQLKVPVNLASLPDVESARSGSTSTAQDYPLLTDPVGLVTPANSLPYSGDVTTGQAVGISQGGTTALSLCYDVAGSKITVPAHGGGACYVFAAAGTYDVSVQFKATSGSVTVKNRKLWVWSMF
jgi:hypothetical protein